MRIAIITHKDIAFPNIPYHFPLLVGAYLNKSKVFDAPANLEYDDNGINISSSNSIYNELTGHYWMWKNMRDESYYGLCHYRRYFNFAIPSRFARIGHACLCKIHNRQYSWDKETIYNTIHKYDIIVAKEEPDASANYKSLKEKFLEHESKTYELWVACMNELYPDYMPYVEKYVSQKGKHMFNMFIMSKQCFDEYSKWLFDILFLYERKCREIYGDNISRMCGFLGEHLLNVYLLYKKDTSNLKIGELQTVMFYNTDKSPTFRSKLNAYFNSIFTMFFPYGSQRRDFIKYNYIMKKK